MCPPQNDPYKFSTYLQYLHNWQSLYYVVPTVYQLEQTYVSLNLLGPIYISPTYTKPR